MLHPPRTDCERLQTPHLVSAFEQDLVLQSERSTGYVPADIQTSPPMLILVPGSVIGDLVPAWMRRLKSVPLEEDDPLVLEHIAGTVLEQAAHLLGLSLHRPLAVSRQDKQSPRAGPPPQLAQPRVLSALIDVGEHAVVVDQIKRAVRIRKRRIRAVHGKRAVRNVLASPGNGSRINV